MDEEIIEQIDQPATLPIGTKPCPTCKGSVSCQACKGTGIAKKPDGSLAYCPRCWGFGCCLHCRGQGILLKESPGEPCRICGTAIGSHQHCKIAEWMIGELKKVKP